MKVLLTGQVGLDRGGYLKEVQRLAHQRGVMMSSMAVGPKMIEMYQGRVDDRTILNLPKALLDLLRRYAWGEILTNASSVKSSEIFIVNTHAVFRWHHGMFPAIDLDLVLKLKPDVFVTLIDDVDKVKRRLRDRGTDFFELWELLAWWEEEIWLTKFLCDSANQLVRKQTSPYFILPISQGPELLFRLLTERNAPKVYLSFAATGLPPRQLREIDTFKQKVSKRFVAFDPLAIQERSILTKAHSLAKEISADLQRVRHYVDRKPKRGQKIWSAVWDEWSGLALAELRGDVPLPGRQVVSIVDAIDSQIISRDFLLIDQSDFVLMYIRTGEDGTPQISAGSQSEMIYAYSQGKPVYVVCPGGRKALSPWVTEFSEVFENLESAFTYLDARYPSP